MLFRSVANSCYTLAAAVAVMAVVEVVGASRTEAVAVRSLDGLGGRRGSM